MKSKKIMKKLGAALLATTMAVSSLSQLTTPVAAQDGTEIGLPDKTQFATAEQLKSFNTNDNDGQKNPAKVYFGNNDQQWWIAGSQQEQGLTLFAASPLMSDQVFEPNYTQNKTYSSNWNCDYTSSSNPSEVYPNHYGASPLRSTLKNLETSYFTGAEQGLMNDTRIYTNDTKNNSIYSTTDKLYLAYADYSDSKHITVGTNSSANDVKQLNSGLRVDMDYWGKSRFWLRSPYIDEDYNDSDLVRVAAPKKGVSYFSVQGVRELVPAFELNLSSVIFASAAPAVSSEGTLATNGAFTLRHKTDTLGSALVSYDKSKVILTDVPSGTYLVVQNSSEAKAKQITDQTSVSATDMGLDSFANCKVWLETTDSTDRMTYATLAEEEKGVFVEIKENTGLHITSNNGVQEVAPNTAITDITVEVTDVYYLPEDYIDNLQNQLTGLTVTKTDTGFTISGTPTSDVDCRLPAPTEKYFVGFSSSEGLSFTNGKQYVKPGDSITDIQVYVLDGYYFPEDYADNFQNLNGLVIENQTSTGFTITGTPTSDVRITLPAATPKADQTFPTDITLSGTGGSGVGIYGTTTAMEYAPVISTMAKDISSSNLEWKDCQNQFTPVAPGTYLVRLKETETKKASDTVEVIVTAPQPDSGSGSGSGGGSTQKVNPVYRAYNPNNGEHLYTLNEEEYKHVTTLGWDAEGVAFMAEEEKNGLALYRVYNPNSGLHHYTLDETEKNELVSKGWKDEGVAWYTSKKTQSAPVYRVYNPNDGNHHYTMSKQEKDTLVSYGWHDEGIAFRTAPIETK